MQAQLNGKKTLQGFQVSMSVKEQATIDMGLVLQRPRTTRLSRLACRTEHRRTSFPLSRWGCLHKKKRAYSRKNLDFYVLIPLASVQTGQCRLPGLVKFYPLNSDTLHVYGRARCGLSYSSAREVVLTWN